MNTQIATYRNNNEKYWYSSSISSSRGIQFTRMRHLIPQQSWAKQPTHYEYSISFLLPLMLVYVKSFISFLVMLRCIIDVCPIDPIGSPVFLLRASYQFFFLSYAWVFFFLHLLCWSPTYTAKKTSFMFWAVHMHNTHTHTNVRVVHILGWINSHPFRSIR